MDGNPSPTVRASSGLSLRVQLILLVLACILPFVAFTLFNRYAEYAARIEATGQGNLVFVRSVGLLIDAKLQGYTNALRALATANELRTGDLAGFRAQAEDVAQQFPGSSITLLRIDGQQLINTARPPGEALPGRPDLESIRHIIATGEPVVSNVSMRVSVQDPAIAIDVAVRDEAGTVTGALSISPNLDDILAVLRAQQLPAGWAVGVLDRAGVVVARAPGENRVGRQAAPDFLYKLLADREGVVETRTLDGVEVFTAFSHAMFSGWVVSVSVPRAQLMAPALAATGRTLAMSGVTLAIALALALLVARRITRPIETLQRLATEPDALMDLQPTGLRETDEVAAALQIAEINRRQSAAQESRTRGALLASQQDFAYLFDHSPLPQWIYHPETLRFLAVNQAAVASYGYSRAEFAGMRMADLLPSEVLDRLQALVERIGPDHRSGDWRIRRKDGRVIEAEIYSHEIAFEGVDARLAVIIDVTARRPAEPHEAG